MKGKANIESIFLYALVVLVCIGGSAFGRIIYVDDDAPGLDIGTSWDNAIDSLQDALLLAYFYDKPVEIRVAGGVYTPDKGIGIAAGDREASFWLIDGVTIKGGYAGLIADVADTRDIELYETILSGDLEGNDGSDITTKTDNSYHVVICDGADQTAVLDGLTITAGSTTDWLGRKPREPLTRGGGLYNDSGSPTLRSCTISGNMGEYGAGVYNIDGNPTFVNCTFSENSANENGAAIYNEAGGPRLLSCTFTGNSAIGGGAIYNDYGELAVTNCTFNENSSRRNGGAVYNYLSTSKMADCDFIANSATRNGGAVYNYGGTLVFQNCTFMENSASNSGGAILDSSSLYGSEGEIPGENVLGNHLSLTNCIFCRNSAAEQGGAILWSMRKIPGGRGGKDISIGEMNLRNCTFTGNLADRRGGAILANDVYVYSSYIIIDPAAYTQANIDGCIFWDNTPDEIYDDSDEDVTVKYCDIKGGFPGEGNIDMEPLFADPENDDYHLKSAGGRWNPAISGWVIDQSSSPCIDAGNPDVSVGLERFPNGDRINMGAYGGTPQASLSPSQLPLLYSKAYNLNPPDGSLYVNANVILSWAAGLNAEFHDVYFGIDLEAITAADTSDTRGIYRGRRSATNYDPSEGENLTSGLYYWRIDEVSSDGEIVTGDIWSFNTGMGVKGRACFIGQTKVWIDGSLVPISEAAAAQLVSGLCGKNKIERIQAHNGAFTCYDIVLESGKSITVAENHYFMTDSGRWLSLKDLTTDTRLKTSKSSIGIKSITRRPQLYVGKVYNLKIEGSDQYMVGEDAIIVRDY